MKLKTPGTVGIGRDGAFFICICHLAIAVILYFKASAHAYTPYYWGSIFVILCSVPYFISIINSSFIPYEGHYFFLAGLLVSFTACLFLPYDKLPFERAALERALQLISIGTLVFLIGYYTPCGKALAKAMPIKRFVIPDPMLSKVPAKLYVIGWIFRLIPTLSNIGVSAFQQLNIIGIPMTLLNKIQGWEITNMITSYGICAALMIDAYIFLSNESLILRRRSFVRLSFFLLLEIASSFFSGMAGNIIRPFIFIFLAYMKTRKKVPIVPIIIIASFFILYIVPFVKTFREQYWYGANFETSMDYAKEKVSDKDLLSVKRDETVIRLSNPLEMAILCRDMRDEGRKLSTQQDIPGYISRFVPRFLWPDKPVVDYNALGREIGLLHMNDYGTSIGLTLIGGLIMDGGDFAVIVGMFVLGVLIRMIWQWFIVRANENMFAFVVYCILIYRFIFPEDFYAVLHSISAFIIYAYFLAAFINRSRYKQTKAA